MKFLGLLARSFNCAFRGIGVTFKYERNFKIHALATCIAVSIGLYLGLSISEWGLVILSVGLVLAAELFNTAIERLGNEVAGGKLKESVRDTKDISAAAVLVAALTALVIGIIVLFIPFVSRMVAGLSA